MLDRVRPLAALLLPFALPIAAAAPKGGPSRKAVQGCVWEKKSDANAGLEAWVQKCVFGSRQTDFLFVDRSLAIRYSDTGAKPDPMVDVLDLQPGETPEAGLKRIFAARTDKAVASRCVLATYKPFRYPKTPPGVKRYTFVPDAAYAKELAKKNDPNEIPDPPCGDLGDMPDGIQYFEVQPKSGVARVLFVRIGQDEALFDEQTLKLLPPATR